MTIVRRAFLAMIAMALIAPAAAKAPARPAAARDWSKSFAVSPAGGFVMGNPKAKLQVVEYGSLTCPHCRHFAQDASRKFIAQYVRTGRASYEFRPMVLNAADLAATLVARCAGPSRFFSIADRLYATQPVWTARTEAMTEEKLAAIPEQQVALKMAEVAQLFPLARAAGLPEAKARACLTSQALQAKMAEMYQSAIDAGVKGTPTFLFNGKQVPVWDWQSLRQELRKAGV